MTKEQINNAIAEAQGFRERGGGPFGIYYDKEDDDRYWVSPEYIEGFKPPWTDFDGAAYYPLPDYCNDLNAMHEVIKTLDTKQQIQYADVLCRQTGKELLDYTGCYYPGENPIIDMEIIFLVHNSTALQRAEAYLRTIGK